MLWPQQSSTRSSPGCCHLQVADKETLLFGLLFVVFLGIFLLFGFYLMFLGRSMYCHECTTQLCY